MGNQSNSPFARELRLLHAKVEDLQADKDRDTATIQRLNEELNRVIAENDQLRKPVAPTPPPKHLPGEAIPKVAV